MQHRQNKVVLFPGIAAIVAFLCMAYGAYRAFVDFLYDPLFTGLSFLADVRIEDKVLLVIVFLGLFAIWSFRTRRPPQ